jgi:transcriptional regulator with GAF, ATPase, and Fis domain
MLRHILKTEAGLVTDGMDDLVIQIDKASRRKDAILVLGESGTGKSNVARGIEALKKYHGEQGSLTEMNCAATPLPLMDAKLFGNVRGAYTDARHDHKGVLEMADKGRLFLDEIGELSYDMQAKLLRVIEDGEVEKLGAEKTIHVDVQILAATSASKVTGERSAIRPELYYRLSANEITLPPFRERPPEAKQAIVEQAFRNAPKKVMHGEHAAVRIEPEVIIALAQQPFRGNIRELINTVTNVFADAAYEQMPKTMHNGEEVTVHVNLSHAKKYVLDDAHAQTDFQRSTLLTVPYTSNATLDDMKQQLFIALLLEKLRVYGVNASVVDLAKSMGVARSSFTKHLSHVAGQFGITGDSHSIFRALIAREESAQDS